MLNPILASLASEYEGRFQLTKIDTDQQQQLASEYGVRSLPTVKIFKDARPVDEFTGVLPERAVREFIERHLPRPADDVMKLANDLASLGKISEAVTLLNQALEDDPSYDKLRLALAGYQHAEDGIEEARTTLKGVSPPAQQDEAFKGLLARIEIRETALNSENQDTLLSRLQSTPDDHDSRRRLSAVLFERGEAEAAMDHLLEMVRTGQSEIKASARENLLQVFQALGSSDDRVSRYRRLLAQALN
jgi:putative thioredoxin